LVFQVPAFLFPGLAHSADWKSFDIGYTEPMRTPVLFFMALSVFVAGCENKGPEKAPASTNAASSANPLDAPGDYLGGLAKGQQSAIKTVDTSSINKAIDMFNVEQGRFPKDLNELVEKKFMPQLPPAPAGMKLDYDAASGRVKVVPK
jgi:hypothetical protein